MGASNYVHLDDCSIVRETDSAFLIGYDGKEYWIPKSQIADEGDNLMEGAEEVTVSVTEWFAKQKGLEG